MAPHFRIHARSLLELSHALWDSAVQLVQLLAQLRHPTTDLPARLRVAAAINSSEPPQSCSLSGSPPRQPHPGGYPAHEQGPPGLCSGEARSSGSLGVGAPWSSPLGNTRCSRSARSASCRKDATRASASRTCVSVTEVIGDVARSPPLRVCRGPG